MSECVERASIEVREQMELEKATANEKAIGRFLLEAFPNEQELAKAFAEGNQRLSALWAEVVKRARKYLNGKDGAVDDPTVWGWVRDAVMGRKGTAESEPKAEAKTQPKPKPIKKPKENPNQLSLFDFMEAPNE